MVTGRVDVGGCEEEHGLDDAVGDVRSYDPDVSREGGEQHMVSGTTSTTSTTSSGAATGVISGIFLLAIDPRAPRAGLHVSCTLSRTT
mmetsp:Transcript_26451/g.53047  ORF Transcript_26451/g.53047 Transcript_26451/m.53047 type:complete len:88 (+) Transcript_26451:239-502(+)